VVTGVEQPEVLEVVEDFARRANAPLYRLGREIKYEVNPPDEAGGLPRFRVNVETPRQRYEGLTCPLPGEHQCRNLALAVTAYDLFCANSNQSIVRNGLAALNWPLRIEEVGQNPRVILDSAHNDASMKAFCETLAPLKPSRRVLIFATSRDKDASAMLRILNRSFDEVIVTRYVQNPRALPVDQLAQLATSELTIPWQMAPDPASAWDMALARVDLDGLICVSGSVFLAAEMQPIVKGAK
jgi:dihydrofolate synthase/folylpolyglutamate synthase